MILDKIKGGLHGVIMGDALGYPYEFLPRSQVQEEPITDILEEQRIFTDDSSLTLCTIESLSKFGNNLSQIAKSFVKWFKEGHWTPDEASTIGIGMIVGTALTRLDQLNLYDNPIHAGLTHEQSNGNGSLMRILPVILYNFRLENHYLLKIVHEVSMITHAHPRSLLGCGIYALLIKELLTSKSSFGESLSRTTELVYEFYKNKNEFSGELDHYARILNLDILSEEEKNIQSTGYVVHTLEASIWSVTNSTNFRDSLLKAVNLGDDTDTVAAVTGGISGVLYGYSSISEAWLQKIVRINDISALIDDFISNLEY